MSPSRFVYQYPLCREGYTNKGIIEDFLEDVVRNKPRLIVDTKNSETPMYDFEVTFPQTEADLGFLRSNYRFKENLGSWTVYEYAGK